MKDVPVVNPKMPAKSPAIKLDYIYFYIVFNTITR